MHGKRPTISSLHGIVAAAHPLAAQAGARLLVSGGNAFDAAAATAAALNVVEPFMSGLAGLGMATCYVAAEKRVRTLDFAPPVPSRLPVERFKKREDLQRGALAVGTPGNLAGWAELVRAYGKKPLADALQPAIVLARDGFALAEFGVAEFNEQIVVLRASDALYQAWAENYTGGAASVALGHIVCQPQLARTLESIASLGPRHLFGGDLGEAIVAHLSKLGGCLTMADLAAVKPQWKEPLLANYRGLAVHTLPPPCEGFQFLLTLRILERFELGKLVRNGAEHLDTVWRAIRLAAGERIANNNPPPDRLAHIMSDANVQRLSARVKDGKPIEGPTEQWTLPPPGRGQNQQEHHTTSFSIADREGNVVCVTQSLGSPFGSGVVVPGTGLCLNNFLFWADVNPQSPNRAKPGDALPLCTAPSISLREGKAVLALGTPGSYGILQTQAQALVHYVDFGLALQDAIEQPRARLWDGRLVEPEARIDTAELNELARRGHEIATGAAWTMRVGGMQAVAIDPLTGLLTGAADPRRDGYVVAV
jgi:gamma-glutamyltranspeptidase/glutathione hydrolase